MSIALDAGVRRMRSLYQSGDRLLGRCCRAEYLLLDDVEPMRKLIDRIEIPHARCEDALVLMGDTAADLAPVFGTPCLSLFPNGKIPRDNPPARQILAALIEGLLPEPSDRDEVCCLTIPGNPTGDQGTFGHEYKFLTHLVSLRGYAPLVATSSMSLVLAELAADSFTGIGFELGAGSCCASLSHRGIEIAHVSVPVSGDWIDTELARREEEYAWDRHGKRHLDTHSAARWKESIAGTVLQPSNDREQFLAELIRELVAYVIEAAAAEFARAIKTKPIRDRVPIVLGGGTSRLPGFAALFEQALSATSFPLSTGEIRLSGDPKYTVARGSLIRAELESQSRAASRSAA
ncbi:MAG: hypothetical protein WD648_13150 [Planctomycetaceae bacterium]